ncbi:Conserved_hypothetical protein [Hexamita inflata]|uniref:Uncharacterized protein n=1 Tax=Hexamita inflata TaxID=28002 RepID=A0AA86Q3D4_9EUKA|nr:Conserved hypothetical protein [Hexamita inflata]
MTIQAESEYQHSVNDFQLSFIQVLSDGFSSYGDLFNGLLQQVFDSVEEHFVQRPLYVMFESALNCDPLTDHLRKSPFNKFSRKRLLYKINQRMKF